MLCYHRTSILTSQAQTVVNTVNTIGVMGKGLASAFKSRYPEMFKAYRKLCQDGLLDIGKLWLWKGPDQWVLNFPTKKHWRAPSKLEYVETGLQKFVEQYEQRGITEIAFPRLGCGNGGLDWVEVRPLMELYLRKLPITVYIHDFEKEIGSPEHTDPRLQKEFYRSFDNFVSEIGAVIHCEKGQFHTFSNNTPFTAELDPEKNLIVRRAGRRSTVPNEELYEMWTLLLRSPLMRRNLPGAARDSAYYIFPILTRLPYIRPIELGQSEDDSAIAIELLDQESSESILPTDETGGQGELEWA